RANELFSRILADPKRRWKFNQSPLFLQFLMGTRDFECTPWGNPTYNIFGWQRPCYLLQEGYAATFKELLETTRWERYGKNSGNVTVVKADGTRLEGYVFNRNRDVEVPFVQVFDRAGAGPLDIPYADIRTILFTGKDTAAGNSYAAWLRAKEASQQRLGTPLPPGA